MRLSRMITAVDAHAGGEPGRVVVGGVLDVPGDTMYDKMAWLRQEGDDLRQLMLREPRGYPATCCNLVLPPCHPGADAGVVIMEQVEYPPMSGSNTICVVTVLVETGMVRAVEPLTTVVLDTPAGLVTAEARVAEGRVTAVTFRNVPAFAAHLDAVVEVPGVGALTVDVAWGGMFYVIADAGQLGLRLAPDEGADIVRLGEMIKLAAQEQLPVSHPERPEVSGVTVAELTAPPSLPGSSGRNAVVVSTGQASWERPASLTGVLDRSPCGTGTCARMAVLHAKGRLGLDEDFRHEGILSTVFTGRLVAEATVGPYPAVVPAITGQGWITGFSQYVVAADDPFPTGFTVGDLWGAGAGSGPAPTGSAGAGPVRHPVGVPGATR
ncbi:MAG: proline racemase family protein [Acidimicrobiales bacterium]